MRSASSGLVYSSAWRRACVGGCQSLLMLQPSLCLSDLELLDDGLADVTQRESPLFAADGDVPHNVAQLILDGGHPLRGHLALVAPHLLDLLGDLTGLAAESERRVHLSHHVATAGVDSRRPSQMLEVEEHSAPIRPEVINTSHVSPMRLYRAALRRPA